MMYWWILWHFVKFIVIGNLQSLLFRDIYHIHFQISNIVLGFFGCLINKKSYTPHFSHLKLCKQILLIQVLKERVTWKPWHNTFGLKRNILFIQT